MKDIYSKFLIFLAALPAMLSCEDSIRTSLPSPEDRMHIKVSAELVTVSFSNPEASAVTFTWEDTGFKDEGVPYNYWFKMDIAGNSFETSIDKRQVTGKNEISFTGVELKSFLNKWGVQDGTLVRVEAEIIAEPVETEPVENQKYRKPEVSKVEFNLICETALKWNEIWMVGDATEGGWNADPFRIKLEYDGENSLKGHKGVFYVNLHLSAGQFKFPLEERTFEVPYLMPDKVGDDGLADLPAAGESCAMKYVAAPGSPDHKWRVTADRAGDYRLVLDTEEMTMTVYEQ